MKEEVVEARRRSEFNMKGRERMKRRDKMKGREVELCEAQGTVSVAVNSQMDRMGKGRKGLRGRREERKERIASKEGRREER